MASKQNAPITDIDISEFETSKQEFIKNVRLGYEKFLTDNGVDLESEIRAKLLGEKKAKKLAKKQESFRVTRLGIVSDMLCELEYKFSDKINEFYGDLLDVEIISEWYYNDCNVTIELVWSDKTLCITNYDGILKISGGEKGLRKYIKSNTELIRDFINISDEYYYLNDEYYTSSSKNSE
jgi:hypothetical protein